MATRLAMVAVVLTALMVLVGASENHEWFVADLGVSSDLGEDVQADKAPLSAGMIVTLRGGSANHHCGDASGSTACRHKSPTEHQKYRVVNAGGGKIGLRRGTAAFVGKVPSFVQFEVVKTSSGKITIKVPGGGYCAGKRNGPSECSLDVSSSDDIAVVCVHNCGKEKEDTPPKAAKQAGTSKRPVKPSLFDPWKGKATRRGASSKAKKGTPSVADPAKEKKIKAKIMKEAAKPKAKKGTLNVADPATEKKSKIVKEAANKKARGHKRDMLKAAAVARKNKIAFFLKNGTKEKKAVDKKSKQKQKTVKKKAQAAKKTVAKKKGEKKKAKGKKKKAKKAVRKKAGGKKKKVKEAVRKKAGGKKKKAKKAVKKKAGGKKKSRKKRKSRKGKKEY